MLIFRAWATCVETSSSPGLTATKSIWRTCRVYHVEFPQILKELEGTLLSSFGHFKFTFLVCSTKSPDFTTSYNKFERKC